MCLKLLLILYLRESRKIFVLGDMTMKILLPSLPFIRFLHCSSDGYLCFFFHIEFTIHRDKFYFGFFLIVQSKGLEWDVVFIVKVISYVHMLKSLHYLLK